MSGMPVLAPGGLLPAQMPMAAAAAWVVGLLVGIDLIFAGLTAGIAALSEPSADDSLR
jgi:uncharacterized membrane protein HdeD (DUF308 family)